MNERTNDRMTRLNEWSNDRMNSNDRLAESLEKLERTSERAKNHANRLRIEGENANEVSKTKKNNEE